jgi:signal transduction histidine kinase
MQLKIQPTRALGLLAALTALVVMASAALLAWEMRKRDLERERLDTAGVAHMLREESERAFESADRVLRGVQERMESGFGNTIPLDGDIVRILLATRAMGSPAVELLAIADARGRVVNASRGDVELAPSIAGAPYFKALVAGSGEGLFFGPPVERGAGEWTVDLARRVMDRKGQLRAIVVLTMRMPDLEAFRTRMDTGHKRPLALYLQDRLAAAAPPLGVAPDGRAPQPGPGAVVLRADAFPFYVSATSDEATVLAAWRDRALSIMLGAFAVCAFTLAAAFVLGRELQREARLARALREAQEQYDRERRRAEAELRETNQQLRALSSSLQEVREQERTRIAAELHDELGQQLTGLKLELSWFATRMKEGRPPTIEQVDAMRHQLDGTIGSVRRIATELRPRVLDDLALGEALAWQAQEFARRSGLEVDVQLAAADSVADAPTATALFRIVQESLTNIARHAHATKVQVRLESDGEALRLSIHDDGRGLARTSGGGLGLVGMRERALALGGRLVVTGAPGAGTTVEVVLPLYAHGDQPQEAEA